jgi:hypothetical protein
MPQVFVPFATDAKGQTLYEPVQANPPFCSGQDRRSRKRQDPAHGLHRVPA